MPIVKDENDKWRFIRSLYYLNDVFLDDRWCRASYDHLYASQTGVSGSDKLFYRPIDWPKREPLVKILAYILMPNHFHLILKEIKEGGISIFMKKLGQSMTNHFNDKYESKGSIFQGSYKSRTIKEDVYFRYLSAYVMVKNAFELFPGGLEKGRENFEEAWKFAAAYPFSSLADYVSERNSPIIDRDLLGEIFESKSEFKNFARDVILGGKWEKNEKDKKLRGLSLE